MGEMDSWALAVAKLQAIFPAVATALCRRVGDSGRPGLCHYLALTPCWYSPTPFPLQRQVKRHFAVLRPPRKVESVGRRNASTSRRVPRCFDGR